MALTIADLIKAVDADAAAVASDNDAVAALNSKYATDSAAAAAQLAADQAKAAADTDARNAAVTGEGGVYVVNPDGTALAYEPDGSGGVKVTTLKAADSVTVG